MVKRLTVISVVCMLVVCIFAGGAFSAVDKKAATDDPEWMRHISEDFAPSETFRVPSQQYPTGGIKYMANCTPIYPDPAIGAPIVHQQIGTTWYDFQKNGSVGRMIDVTNNGYAHHTWMYTAAVYPGTPRIVKYVKELPDHTFFPEADAGPGPGYNSGYCNVTHLHDGTPVVVYHETGEFGRDCVLAAADDEVGNVFNRHWDLPDGIADAASQEPMMWPKGTAQYDSATGIDYIHIVGTEGELTGGTLDKVAYIRCYIDPGDPFKLICQSWVNGACSTYTRPNNEVIVDPALLPISSLSASCSVDIITVVSPVSKKVAIIWLTAAKEDDCDYHSDVAYVESNHLGDEWINGTNWPPPPIKLTNYGTTGNERAYNDVSACYDYKDSLHIIYTTTGFNPKKPGYFQPGVARLWHWSKATGKSYIAGAIWGGTSPGSHCLNIAKIQVAAKDPIYHPGGDSTYLYATWSQFDKNDNSAGRRTESDLYGSGSFNDGSSWGQGLNLTGTKNPGCTPGTCVSEHWHSLATNMYNGDLYMQYICDRDPGGAIQGEGQWTENPVMKLVLPEWRLIPGPRGYYNVISPDNWYDPPLKIDPTGSRELSIRIYSCGSEPLDWDASGSNDLGCIWGTYSGLQLASRDSTDVLTFTISGAGACNNEFICGKVVINTNEGGGTTSELPVLAVVANDYYECPDDPVTYDTVDNRVLRLYANANSQEWFHDIAFASDTAHEVFFQGGTIIATTVSGDTVVGRCMGQNDQRAGARDKLYTVEFDVTWEPDFYLVYTKDIYIYPPVPECPQINTMKWYWWEMSKQIKFFKRTAPAIYKRLVIEYITVRRHDPPVWWPTQPKYTDYEDTYIGMAMDIDCPWDSAGFESAMNLAGYDATKNIAWMRGKHRPAEHPEYNDYYAGIALADGGRPGEDTIPYGAYNVKNHTHLYPQSPWGWLDGDLYQLAATAGANIEDGPTGLDSALDRTQVFTARKINAGKEPSASFSFTLVEGVSYTGLAGLDTLIDTARAIVTRGGAYGIRLLCGDMNCDGVVGLGDLVYFTTYRYKNGPAPCFPLYLRADVNGDGVIGLGDLVYFTTYQYKNGPALKCEAGSSGEFY
jgi:hypothetical protein